MNLLLLLLACTRGSTPSAPAADPAAGVPVIPAEDPPPAEIPAEVPVGQAPIELTAPGPGTLLSAGELLVTGTASVWEGRLEVVLLAGDEVLDQAAVSAGVGAPGRGSFTAPLTVPSGRGGPGLVRAYARSAADGAPVHAVEVPIQLP